jgi:hypothetical protein
MAARLAGALLDLILAVSPPLTGKSQDFSSFAACLPLDPGDTLVIGIVGGWVDWSNPYKCTRRTALELRALKIPGVHVETVENHRLFLAEELIRRAFDTNRDGRLEPAEAAAARLILFGQSLGGRAVLRLTRTLETWGVPVMLALVIDGFGPDDYSVPPNVREVANFFQRGPGVVRGARALHPKDPSKTRIIGNWQFHYWGRTFPMPHENPWGRIFSPGHARMEYDPEVWGRAIALIRERLPRQ